MNLIQVGTSAGGARAKAVVAWNPDTNEIRSGQLPADPGFEHWLLKLDGVGEGHDLSTGKGYGRIECAYYLMAREAGINISESRLLEENGRAHFMTRRFDRRDSTKLHLQTLCAMQHLDYRQRATHDYSQYFQTVKALNLPLHELAEAYRRMIFNVLAANCDDHTKNHSFLMDKTGEWHLAPAYDVTHSFNLAGEWTYQHLMSVNGKFRNINQSDFHTVGDRFMVPDYKGIIRSVASAIKRWPEFAKAAGLATRDAERIQNDFRIDT
jgi:serine/threonine-protein kinase HipA